MYLASNDVIRQVRSFDMNAISADMRTKYEAGIAQDGQANSRILSVSGNVATIGISGVLTHSYGFMTWLMGGTAYTDIMAAMQMAELDPEINDIRIKMNSGGGQVSGLFDLIAQMESMKTPMTCEVSGMCCSAAYAIASQCDSIVTASEGEGIGSIGIVVEAYIDENVKSITSTNAPNKRPDASTEEGVAQIRAELDAYEDLFIEAIAAGRGTNTADIKANYGQGSVTTARNALKSGMIDAIASQSGSASAGTQTNLTAQGETEHQLTANSEEVMNKAELQAKHPELYAEIKNEGIQAGKTQEQERVSAFAELGEASGAGELAMACIKDGTEHSASINAKFMAAQMKNNSLSALAADNVDTDNIVPKAPAAKTEEELLDEQTIAAFGANKMETY
ncbi:major capsid protein [Vibrio phage 1.158.O._10N.261.45.E12]|nr:major capsid protein [Vibrio phage 1.158.O._10N.261.45.E12]AUR92633.1 major capsid protein [Vibrio phage 1.175.O._10N.261.55.B3]